MNLLSPEQKEIIRKDILIRFYFALLTVFSFWALVFLVLIHSINLYLEIQVPALGKRIEIERLSERSLAYGLVEQEINDFNTRLAKIEKIRSEGILDIGQILKGTGAKVPDGVFLTNLSYQGDVLSINGHADTRDQALQLKEALEKDSLCASLISPVIVKETDINFSFVCTLTSAERVQQEVITDEEEEDIYE